MKIGERLSSTEAQKHPLNKCIRDICDNFAERRAFNDDVKTVEIFTCQQE
jgi:hypothetical protein